MAERIQEKEGSDGKWLKGAFVVERSFRRAGKYALIVRRKREINNNQGEASVSSFFMH